MIEYRPGGRRPIDRILDPSFVAGLADLDLATLRERRNQADQEDTDLSYARRLLQGRLDILRDEQRRRTDGSGAAESVGTHSDAEIVERLRHVLCDSSGARQDRGMGRVNRMEPSRVGEHRRAAEAAVADPALSDAAGMDGEALAAAVATLVGLEHEVSAARHKVQQVVDLLTEQMALRYQRRAASQEEAMTTGP